MVVWTIMVKVSTVVAVGRVRRTEAITSFTRPRPGSVVAPQFLLSAICYFIFLSQFYLYPIIDTFSIVNFAIFYFLSSCVFSKRPEQFSFLSANSEEHSHSHHNILYLLTLMTWIRNRSRGEIAAKTKDWVPKSKLLRKK